MPGDDEAAAVERRHRGSHLIVSRIGVDLELGIHRAAGGVEPLAMDAISVAVLIVGLPGDDEAAAVERRHRGSYLIAGRESVDLELGIHRATGGVVTLAMDAVVAAILIVRLPGDDEAAAVETRHRGIHLIAGGIGIDQELASQRAAAGVVTLAVYADAAAVLIA